jgi:hypothetical protein
VLGAVLRALSCELMDTDMLVRRVGVTFALLLMPLAPAASQGPRAVFSQTIVDFGTAVQGATIVHEFILQNEGAAALRIRGLQATAPLLPDRIPAQIAPGSRVVLRLRLDTTALSGHFEGVVLVSLDDPALAEARLTVVGRVVPPIEVAPAPAFFVAAQRGERKEVALEIVSHEPEPLAIEAVEHLSQRFTTRLDTVEAGRRYRLTVVLDPASPAGKNQDVLRIRTSRRASPVLTIPVYTNIRERVYTFPDAVDLGVLRLSDIKADPDLLQRTAQTLMIYQSGGSNFGVTLSTDLSELDLKWERGRQGDRYQATVSLNREKLRVGPIKGSIVIETNDPQYPTVTVPVSAAVIEGR